MTTRIQIRPPVEEMIFQLYGRPLHPEVFEILASRRIRGNDFTLDLWITTTGHVITWNNGRSRLTELTTAGPDSPGWGQLLSHKLRGEHCDMLGTLPNLNYQVSFQVETLPPNLFQTVHEEILADGGRRRLAVGVQPQPSLGPESRQRHSCRVALVVYLWPPSTPFRTKAPW